MAQMTREDASVRGNRPQQRNVPSYRGVLRDMLTPLSTQKHSGGSWAEDSPRPPADRRSWEGHGGGRGSKATRGPKAMRGPVRRRQSKATRGPKAMGGPSGPKATGGRRPQKHKKGTEGHHQNAHTHTHKPTHTHTCEQTHTQAHTRRHAHSAPAGSRTWATSMGVLYDAATLQALLDMHTVQL